MWSNIGFVLGISIIDIRDSIAMEAHLNTIMIFIQLGVVFVATIPYIVDPKKQRVWSFDLFMLIVQTFFAMGIFDFMGRKYVLKDYDIQRVY